MDNSYTNTVLQTISQKLNEGVQDINAVSFVIAAFIIVIIVLPVILRIRNRRLVREKSEASFQKLIRKFNLTILELDLIEKLAASLKKSQEKYQLLINKTALRHAVSNTGGLDDDEEEILHRLSIKLGFIQPSYAEQGFTTKYLHPGYPVKIMTPDKSFSDAEVYSNSENNIAIKYYSAEYPVTPDEEVLLLSTVSSKFREFRLIPDKVKEEIFSSPHTASEEIRKSNVRIDVEAEKENIEDEDPPGRIKLVIVMLSEEGAFLYDKNNILEPAENIRIYLDNDIKQEHPVYAEVLKVSEEKKLVSVKFIEENTDE